MNLNDDLPRLISQMLGHAGRVLFYVGIFAAIYSSLIGHALGLGDLGSHALMRWRLGPDSPLGDYRRHACYFWIAVWCLLSPLVWTTPGMPALST